MPLEKKKIKIVYIINSLGFGGRENVVIDLCNHIDKDDFEVHLIIFSKDANEQLFRLNPSVIIHTLDVLNKDLEGIRVLKVWFKILFRLTAALRRIDPGIVHSHVLFHWLLLISIAIRNTGNHIRYYNTVHTSGLYYASGGVINRLRLNTEKLAGLISKVIFIAVSDAGYEKLKMHFSGYKNRIYKIYNGVDFNKFSSVSAYKDGTLSRLIADRKCIVYVSRLDKGKDHLTLLKAWNELLKKYDNCVLLLIGEGVLKGSLETWVKEQQLGKSVLFLGERKDVPELLMHADIAVFPSLFEGFSISLIEKMAMKIPVITSDIEAFRGIIKHGENGLMFPVSDPVALKNAIASLIEDPELGKKLGEKGYESIQRFSTDSMIRQHEMIYKK